METADPARIFQINILYIMYEWFIITTFAKDKLRLSNFKRA